MGLGVFHVPINAPAAASTAILAAVSGRKLYLHGFVITADTTATVAEFEAANGSSLTGNFLLPANGSVVWPPTERPAWSLTSGQALHVQATTGTVTGFAVCSIGP